MNTSLIIAGFLAQGFLIQNVTVYVGDGDVQKNVDVLVEGEKIRKVGPKIVARKQDTVIDGEGKILTPGLMETVSQLGLVEVLLEEHTREHDSGAKPFAPDFDVRKGFDAKSSRLAIERAEGVTHIITSPTEGIISGRGAYVDLDGSWPKIQKGMFGSVNQGSAHAAGKTHTGVWQRLGWLFEDLRRYEANPGFFEKGNFDQLRFRREVILGMLPVLQKKVPLMMRAANERDIRNLIALKQKENVDIWVIGGAESWLVAEALVQAPIPVVMTPSHQRPTSFEQLRARDDLPRLLEKAGVTVVISSSSWDQNARRLRQEGGLAVREGMSPQKALAAMTSVPAKLLGLPLLGMVKPGFQANIVLWKGDPLELSTLISDIWIKGRVQPLKSRQDALYERYAP
jgi:imidazolonepropionase-like amidohydrolase